MLTADLDIPHTHIMSVRGFITLKLTRLETLLGECILNFLFVVWLIDIALLFVLAISKIGRVIFSGMIDIIILLRLATQTALKFSVRCVVDRYCLLTF